MLALHAEFPGAFPGTTVYEPVPRPIGPHRLPMFEAHIAVEQVECY